MVSIFYALPVALLFGLFRYGFKKYSNISGKLNESLVKLLYYFAAYTWGQYAIAEVNIWPKVYNCWDKIITGQNNSNFILAYYIFELGWYISETFCLFLFDSLKSDRKQMVIHHLTTIGLLSSSYIYGFQRIGLLVLACHNINDIFLEGAKSLKYLGFEKCANITFIGLLMSWIYSRLYVFTYYILDSTIFYVYYFAVNNSDLLIRYYISNILLLILLGLNIMWFCMICKIAINTIKNGETKDERELEQIEEIEELEQIDSDIYSDVGMEQESENSKDE